MAGIYIDPETRDIGLGGDTVRLTESPTTELLLAIGVEVGTFHGDPDQGSRVPGLISGAPPVDAETAIETAAKDGLRRLETQGLIVITNIDYSAPHGELLIESDQQAVTIEV